VAVVVVAGSGVAFWSFGDALSLRSTLDRLSLGASAALLGLLAFNELVKGLRWAWYLRAARLPIRAIDGLTSYLAAQAASAVPGGALLSARLAEEHGDGTVRLRHTAPPLLAQGFGDLLAVSLLATSGILLTVGLSLQLAAPAVGIALALLLINGAHSDRLGAFLVRTLACSRFTRRLVPAEEDARQTLRYLCTPRALLPGIGASVLCSLTVAAVLALLAETLTIRGLRAHEAIYVHGMTMLAHFLVPVPNGFGTNELSLVGLLNVVGIGFGRATAIAVTYRAVSLGLRTVIGLVVLLARYHHLLWELRCQPVPAPVPVPQLVTDHRE